MVRPDYHGEFGGLRVKLKPIRPGNFYCGENVCFLNFFFTSLSSHWCAAQFLWENSTCFTKSFELKRVRVGEWNLHVNSQYISTKKLAMNIQHVHEWSFINPFALKIVNPRICCQGLLPEILSWLRSEFVHRSSQITDGSSTQPHRTI